MAESSERYIEAHVDTLVIRGAARPGLRMVVKATRSLSAKDPNSCTLSIYNLNPQHRAALTKIGTPAVSIVAGYKDDRTSIFYGQMIHVHHERDRGGNVITTVSTTDGGDKTRKARVYQSFGPRTKTGDVLRALVKALGVKPGNVERVARDLDAGKASNLYIGGVVLDDYAAPALSVLCDSAGLEWSVQEGAIQLLPRGAASNTSAIKLTERQLLVSPSISAKGVVSAAARLQKDFLPGRQVQIAHEFLNGAFRLEKCDYDLDTHGDTWTVDFEAKGPKK